MAAEIAEVAKAIGTGEAQEVAGEQRAQQDNEPFETPVDGRGIEMDRGRTGTQDGDDVESRDETADDRFRNRPALARRTGIPIDDRDIVVAVAAGCCSRSSALDSPRLHAS